MNRFKHDADNVLYKPELRRAQVLHLPGSDDESNHLCSEELFKAIKFIGIKLSVGFL